MARAVEPAAIITIAFVILALLGIWLLPLRKRWNDDGADDARRERRQEDIPEHRDARAPPPPEGP